MPIERAVSAFKDERKSCAESILTAFQDHLPVSEDDLRASVALGRGRAPGGVCGALEAALRLSPSPDTHARIRERFVAQAGSDKCREIRHGRTASCVECVRIAASLTAEHAVQETP